MLRRIRRERLEIIIHRLLVVSSLIFRVPQVVGRDIILSEREIEQENFRNSAESAIFIISQIIRIDRAPHQYERTGSDHQRAQSKEDPAQEGDQAFDLFEIRVHHATPPL